MTDTVDARSGKRWVLVVDDDEAVRWAVADVLREGGFDVWLAADGDEALDSMAGGSQPPALVVLDLMMPRMTGWQVLEAMQKAPDFADTPVLILTGFGARPGLPPGCHVLHKPFEREVLLAEARALT